MRIYWKSLSKPTRKFSKVVNTNNLITWVREKIQFTIATDIKHLGLCILIIRASKNKYKDKHSQAKWSKILSVQLIEKNTFPNLTSNYRNANSKSHMVMWNFFPSIRIPKLQKYVVRVWGNKDFYMFLRENMIWHTFLLQLSNIDHNFRYTFLLTPNFHS